MKKITPLHIVLVILALIALALINTMIHAGDAPQEPKVVQEEKTPYVEIGDSNSPDVDGYKDSQVAHSQKLGAVLSDMADLNTQLMQDPNKILDSSFIAEVEAVGVRMDEVESSMTTLPKAPIEYEISDGLYRQAVAAFAEGIDYYIDGVKQNDLDLIAISIDRTTTGNSLLNQAIEEIQGVN